MDGLVEALIAAACVAGAERTWARHCPNSEVGATLRRAGDWSLRVEILASRVAAAPVQVDKPELPFLTRGYRG